MKSILCYGDSNTWGYIPAKGGRYPRNIRWPGRLEEYLGCGYHVIEEGLCGRTTCYQIPLEPSRNGYDTFPMILESTAGADLVILMLGTNDRRTQLCVSPQESALALERYLRLLHAPALWSAERVPEVLLIAPPVIDECVMQREAGFYYGEKSVADSHCLAAEYQLLAKKYNCAFLNAAEVCTPSQEDGVHLDEQGHQRLAEAVFQIIRENSR
jgi:lysophospholipase L1-like esterase